MCPPPVTGHANPAPTTCLPLLPVLPGSLSSPLSPLSPSFSLQRSLSQLFHGVGLVLVLPVETAHISLKPPDLWAASRRRFLETKPAAQMDSAMPPVAAAAGDENALTELQAEHLIHGMTDSEFTMVGTKGVEAAPTDAGDEDDDDDDDGDDDGDFAEGEEEISEGEEYDNLKANDTKKKQVGEGEENGEDDEEEAEEQEGGGGDDDDDDDDDNEDDDDEEDAGEDDEDGVEEEDDDDQDDEEEDDDEDSLQPPKKRKK